MKHKLFLPLLSVATLALTQCIVDETGNTSGPPSRPPSNAPPSNAPFGGGRLSIITGPQTLQIMQNGSAIDFITTASENIEDYRWLNGQDQIVVKSRGSHGPATVQLFNTRSGDELGRVMAYDIRNGEPAWAYGMED